MRALVLAVSLAVLSPATVRAADALASETVEVQQVKGPLPGDAAAPLWDGLPARSALAAPQRTVRLPDARANEALSAAGAHPVTLRAATDGTELAVVVEWGDPTEDRIPPDATDAYGDAAALELPLRCGAGRRLPYVGMGDAGEQVVVYMQRAGASGVVTRQAGAAGFGSLTRADVGGVRMAMRYDPAAKAWRAIFVRPLVAGAHDLRRGLVPFSIATWDGARGERGGNKTLTRWKFLRLPAYPLDPAYVAEQSWGRAPGDLGSPAKGKEMVESMCVACHRVGATRVAPAGLAPDLSTVGVIATPGYLRDSILRASAVIVPSPNPGQHQDRARRDARGAWLPDESYAWSHLESDGRRVSSMPDFDTMTKEEVADVVAYLVTLGEEPPGGRSQP